MSDDLEIRLRAARGHLPSPDPGVTARAEVAVVGIVSSPLNSRRARRWVGMALGAAAAAALLTVLVLLFVAAPKNATAPAAPYWQAGEVEVPSVVGRRQEEYWNELQTRNLSSTGYGARPSAEAVGTVLEQLPPAGERVARGTQLRLVVAIPESSAPQKRVAAPSFRAPLLNGPGVMTNDDLLGQVVVLYFHASWCAPCRRQLAAPQLPPDASVTVMVRDLEADARGAVLAGIRPALIDSSTPSMADTFGISALPAAVVLDRDGRIAARVDGGTNDAEFSALVAALKAEAAPRVRPNTPPPARLADPSIPPLPLAEVPNIAHARGGTCEVDPERVWVITENGKGGRTLVGQSPWFGEVEITESRVNPDNNNTGCGGWVGPGRRSATPATAPTEPFTFGLLFDPPDGIVRQAIAKVPLGYTEATILGKTFPVQNGQVILEGRWKKDAIVTFSGPAGVRREPLSKE